jgi:hypothetical protein
MANNRKKTFRRTPPSRECALIRILQMPLQADFPKASSDVAFRRLKRVSGRVVSPAR